MEPEEPFEPFEPVRESGEEPASAASSCSNTSIISSISKISSENQNVRSLSRSPARASALLSSLSSPHRVGTSRGGALGKLHESKGDKTENVETLGTPHKGIGDADVGVPISLRGSPQVLGGFRGGVGGRGVGGKPSPASRLGVVDRKWLERCQVFGEMGAEVKPGAGNQEIDLEKRGERETEGKIQGEESVGKIDAEGERREVIDSGRDEEFQITSDKTVSDNAPKPATGKSRAGGEGKAKKKGGEEMDTGLTPPLTPEDNNEISNKSKGTKKRGRKRQRDGENTEGETTEEGGVKKRRRKKKEESSDVNPSPAQEGGKKRRAKKKIDEDGEAEEEKETKEPKKVNQLVCVSHLHILYAL